MGCDLSATNSSNRGLAGFLIPVLIFGVALCFAGCATESSVAIQPQEVASFGTAYNGPKQTIFISHFDNGSGYMHGIFSNGPDLLASQAQTILISYLQSSGRFNVVDRGNMDAIAKEAAIKGQAQALKGADFAISGDVVEFGRKEVGDIQLFGILGSGKKQVAYSKVALNIINVNTSEVVYTVQGAGEYALSDRELLGFGGDAGYDSTLNGKVLDLALREAVNRLVEGLENGAWKAKAGQ
jgi:curli biogenesis system outer membrane secretion channel CsgG